jgi:quercetin dioxygenase-like cupin family protein
MTAIEHLPDLEATPHANVFPSAEPKTVRLALDADERADPHTHPGRDIVLYVVEGAIDLDLDDERHALEAGDVAQFAGEREISPVARERSVALVVLAERAEAEG